MANRGPTVPVVFVPLPPRWTAGRVCGGGRAPTVDLGLDEGMLSNRRGRAGSAGSPSRRPSRC